MNECMNENGRSDPIGARIPSLVHRRRRVKYGNTRGIHACGAPLLAAASRRPGHNRQAIGLDLRADEIAQARMFASEDPQRSRFEQADLLHDAGWETKAERVLDGRSRALAPVSGEPSCWRFRCSPCRCCSTCYMRTVTGSPEAADGVAETQRIAIQHLRCRRGFRP